MVFNPVAGGKIESTDKKFSIFKLIMARDLGLETLPNAD